MEVGAEAGAGNLLANPLCSLVGLLDNPLALLDELLPGSRRSSPICPSFNADLPDAVKRTPPG